MNKKKLLRGAKILIEEWIEPEKGEKIFILTDTLHEEEMRVVEAVATEHGAVVNLHVAPPEKVQDGVYLDSIEDLFLSADTVIGASHYSIVTTRVVQKVVEKGLKFLSLPLSTNKEDVSLIESNLMLMNNEVSKLMAISLINKINKSDNIRISTKTGTDLHLTKKGRNADYFVGSSSIGDGYASASFEVYLAMEEGGTNGKACVDGSLGYLGKVHHPFMIELENGLITKIEENSDGKKLSKYIEDFGDKNMFNASEFGIGLNLFAECDGTSYIEDESAYGTFHLGFGRNLALGGVLDAAGHFDLVFLKPSIYIEDELVIENGEMLIDTQIEKN